MRTIGSALAAGGALLLLPAASRASCGLEGCPVEIREAGHDARVVGHEVRAFSYSLFGVDGDYTRFQSRFDYTRAGWAAGAIVPVVRLREPDEERTRFANPVVFLERLQSAGGGVFAIGLQVEIPVESAPRIANDHFEMLPYLSARTKRAGGTWFAMAGFRLALSSTEKSGDTDKAGTRKTAHGGGDDAVVVNPHEKRELLTRIGFNLERGPSFARPSIYVDADRVVQGEAGGDTFASAGVQLRVPAGKRVTIRPAAEWPFGGKRRFDWNAGIGISVSF